MYTGCESARVRERHFVFTNVHVFVFVWMHVYAKTVFDVNNVNNKLWVQQAHNDWHVYTSYTYVCTCTYMYGASAIRILQLAQSVMYLHLARIKLASARKSNGSFVMKKSPKQKLSYATFIILHEMLTITRQSTWPMLLCTFGSLLSSSL